MDFAGIVQPVGRSGEIFYISSIPNDSPIQAITPVRGKQGSFFGYSDSRTQSYPKSENSSLPSNYREIALEIRNRANAGLDVIVPGMLLDLTI